MVKKAVITHLSIRKTGYLTGIILGTLGLITGIADALLKGIKHGLYAPAASAFLFPGLGMWGIFLYPVFCFIIGFILGIFIAYLFNIAVKMNGGFEVKITDKQE